MPTKPPSRIVIARPPGKRPAKAVAASATRIVYAPKAKQKDAWKRFMALTGRDE
jgi:hypothetical protein